MKKKPAHEIRYGLIIARIWRKRTNTAARYTVSLARLYRNGDEWKESTRFGCDDLPLAALVLNRAHTWIYLTQNKETQSGQRRRG